MCMRTRQAYITHTCKAHTRNHLLTCKAHIHVWYTYILIHTHTHTQPHAHRMQVHNTLLHNTHAHTCTQTHTFANTHIHGLQAYTRRRKHSTNIGRHAHIPTQTCTLSFIICKLKSHTFLHSQTIHRAHIHGIHIHMLHT